MASKFAQAHRDMLEKQRNDALAAARARNKKTQADEKRLGAKKSPKLKGAGKKATPKAGRKTK